MDSPDTVMRPTSPTRPTTPDQMPSKSSPGFGMWQKLHNLFGGDESMYGLDPESSLVHFESTDPKTRPTPDLSRRPVGIGLPRQTTFKRQNSERRERLCPVEKLHAEKRAYSVTPAIESGHSKLRSVSTPPPDFKARSSAPDVSLQAAAGGPDSAPVHLAPVTCGDLPPASEDGHDLDSPRPPRPASVTSSNESYDRQRDALDERAQLNAELDSKWILNLSMHFRDKSDREKFFVTYAENPNKWRRVTVSIDYRNAEPGSLEMDLKELTFQRDKSLQIYEAIRESLTEIQFYDTVTNLKLETSDGRLHVHVTEDVNEIIPYPPRSSLAHVLDCGKHAPMECRESDLAFVSHLSGFVYKVNYKGRTLIKKEIPGPDTVDEFLYEVNALHALADSKHVIHLEGIVLDDTYSIVKGLLISYAEKGAVVDLLYDLKGEIPWERRQRWARHAVAGLSDVHEEGYVQGDFTLSNIVVDARDNARIIDINRRGCPVGWEPPELAQKIASHQRISMYIGQKSDLYQLGMSLWALAMDDDEPERHDPPLQTTSFPADVPAWYMDIVRICLSPQSRDRLSAKDLLQMFPHIPGDSGQGISDDKLFARLRPQKRYIDPETAVERDDLERFGQDRAAIENTLYSPQSSRDDYTFTYPRSSNDGRGYYGSISDFEVPRGRRQSAGHDNEPHSQEFADHMDDADHDDESPPLIERIPTPVGRNGHEMRDEDLDYFIETWNPERSPSESGPPRGRSPGNRAGSAGATAARVNFNNSNSFVEPSHTHSQASEPTPRSSAIHLARAAGPLTDERSGSPPGEGDLAWLGAHPGVDTPPGATPDPQTDVTTDQGDPVDFLPPRLRFVDSGFNEPGLFDSVPDDTDENCSFDSDDEVEQHLAESRRNTEMARAEAQSATVQDLPASEATKSESPASTVHSQVTQESALPSVEGLPTELDTIQQNSNIDSHALPATHSEQASSEKHEADTIDTAQK